MAKIYPTHHILLVKSLLLMRNFLFCCFDSDFVGEVSNELTTRDCRPRNPSDNHRSRSTNAYPGIVRLGRSFRNVFFWVHLGKCLKHWEVNRAKFVNNEDLIITMQI